jgi:hypothetical protein
VLAEARRVRILLIATHDKVVLVRVTRYDREPTMC